MKSKKKSFMKSKKAISPIIATLLLVAIAVAAAVIAYSWVMGFIGGTTSTTAPAQGQITVENMSGLVGGTSSVVVTVRNTGNKAVTMSTIYVSDTNGTSVASLKQGTGSGAWSGTPGISAGTTQDYTLSFTSAQKALILTGHGYTFKVVGTDGTTASATFTAS
jgi:flagellin-like protein